MSLRVVLMADCYVGLQFGDRGTVVEQLSDEKIVRFDRDGSERLILDANCATCTSLTHAAPEHGPTQGDSQ